MTVQTFNSFCDTINTFCNALRNMAFTGRRLLVLAKSKSLTGSIIFFEPF